MRQFPGSEDPGYTPSADTSKIGGGFGLQEGGSLALTLSAHLCY